MFGFGGWLLHAGDIAQQRRAVDARMEYVVADVPVYQQGFRVFVHFFLDVDEPQIIQSLLRRYPFASLL